MKRATAVAVAAGAIAAVVAPVAHGQAVQGSFAPQVCEPGEPCGSVDRATTLSIEGIGMSVQGLGICLPGSLCPPSGPTNPVSWVVGSVMNALGSLDGVPESPSRSLS